jgi:hypothetical protein
MEQAVANVPEPQTPICVAAAIIDSIGNILVGENVQAPGDFGCPMRLLSDPAHDIVDGAAQEALAMFGMRINSDIAPIGVMDEQQAISVEMSMPNCTSSCCSLRWVLFACCDETLECNAMFRAKARGIEGRTFRFWPQELVAPRLPREMQAAFRKLVTWAAPVIDERAQAANSISMEGVWTRDHRRNKNVVETLIARGLAQATAVEEASKPYIQRWLRQTSGKTSWLVTTVQKMVATAQNGATSSTSQGSNDRMQRDLVYELGDWEESYAGHSTLFGYAPKGALLQRRTAWLSEPKAIDPTAWATVQGDDAHRSRMLPPTCVALATWTSHMGSGKEVVARYLRGNEMVVRRTYFPLPLVEMISANLEPVVSEETFVSLGDDFDLDSLSSTWPESPSNSLDKDAREHLEIDW